VYPDAGAYLTSKATACIKNLNKFFQIFTASFLFNLVPNSPAIHVTGNYQLALKNTKSLPQEYQAFDRVLIFFY
jgi:predicted permease